MTVFFRRCVTAFPAGTGPTAPGGRDWGRGEHGQKRLPSSGVAREATGSGFRDPDMLERKENINVDCFVNSERCGELGLDANGATSTDPKFRIWTRSNRQAFRPKPTGAPSPKTQGVAITTPRPPSAKGIRTPDGDTVRMAYPVLTSRRGREG